MHLKISGSIYNFYKEFIKMYEDGYILISKKFNVYDLYERDDLDDLIKIHKDNLKKYNSKDFLEEYESLLKDDLQSLLKIKELWENVDSDPKIDSFITSIKEESVLKNKKIIIFTESKETADYLFEKLVDEFPDRVLSFSSHGAYIQMHLLLNRKCLVEKLSLKKKDEELLQILIQIIMIKKMILIY